MKSTEAKTTTERGCPSRSNVRSQGTAPKAQPLDEGRDLLRLGQPRSVAAISISARLRRLVAFLIVILALASRVVAATCSSPPTNLIGWWPGDGNANDIVSTNNGFLQGGATASGAGFVSSAFTFDGTNGFVQIPNSASLRPTNLTIEAWVRFSGLDSAGSGGSPAGDQYIVFRQNTRSTDFEGFDLSKTRVGQRPGCRDSLFYHHQHWTLVSRRRRSRIKLHSNLCQWRP